MADNWFSTSTQQNLYKFTSDRSLLVVKQSMARRMQADLAKVEAKYDGSKVASIEEDVNKLGDQKLELSTWLSSMDSALKEFNNVRESLLKVKASLAVATPSPAAFDLYYDALNSSLYNEKFDDTSLISNTDNGRGSWTETTTTVSAAGMDTSLPHHYLGNDFAIELDGGAGLLQPDLKGTISGAGHTITRANLKLVSRTDDHVEFQDITDPSNPVTYSGTVKRGGLGVLPAWLYGDLSDPTVKETAKADLAAAFKKVARYEVDFNVAQASLSGIDASLTSKMQSLTDEYNKVANEELDAKTAEKKAIQARFSLLTNSLALTSGRQTNFINQMFNTKAPTKKTLTDIMLSTAGVSS